MGAGMNAAPLFALATVEAAVAAERARCLRIVQSVNNSDNPMTANDCADLISAGSECVKTAAPIFWYRPHKNGFYEGPIHNAQMQCSRDQEDGWIPLYAL